jgi:formylglycine-generating enzyme required for sulfatase activity
VSGTISTDNPSGAASGATVRLKRGTANVGNAVTTGADGTYTISNVPARNGYTVEASLSGYVTGATASFDVTAGNVTGKDLTLAKLTAGDKISYTGEGVTFRTAYVPGGVGFPTGTSDGGNATVAAAYEIGETEVTYELWHKVRSWAEGKGYSFHSNPGREGSAGTTGAAPTGANQEPVTVVSWYDAAVWLNALTEWVNEKTGSNFTPVYYYESGCTTVAKDSTPTSNFVKENDSYSYASAYEKTGATGFRLPSSNEWELAARWRGSDTDNTVSGYTDPYFTQGDSASGATADYQNPTETGKVAWYSDNASGKTQAVKGKTANALGLYDMSGNVWEWCFDWHPANEGSNRIIRGGSWSHSAPFLQVGRVYDSVPDYRYNNFGFRPVRSAE